MALTPWHVASRLSCDDVASLLTGFDISAARAGLIGDHEIQEYRAWNRVIVEASQRGELAPLAVEVLEEEAEPDPVEREMTIKRYWAPCDPENMIWTFGYDADAVRLTFERAEVYRWLKASGIADDDIPEALRVMPKPQAPTASQDKPLHPRRRQTYLTLIEALALKALDGEIPAEPYKAAATLQSILEQHGLKLDKDPIADTVKEIHAAREERASERR
ncbi:hypothetical protein ACR80S_04905 [Halomonas sp. MA07-2]|uniref:hypothetical protein n=1 Tax=Halomonas sp. MA07-2 TaxID=3440841 RepID=UPI003EEA53C0